MHIGRSLCKIENFTIPRKSRREENVEATRAALIAVARRHFARKGYNETDILDIAKDARLTTGAIYHHFKNKLALFQAVAEELESEILATSRSVAVGDPWDALYVAFEKLVDLCARPDVQRIIFVEAPQVIGPAAWREIEMRYAFGAVWTTLDSLRAADRIKPYSTEYIACMLLALLRESSAELARAKGAASAREQVSELASGVFDLLRMKPGNGGSPVSAEIKPSLPAREG
jgi:AcrR family transcriptional regulator